MNIPTTADQLIRHAFGKGMEHWSTVNEAAIAKAMAASELRPRERREVVKPSPRDPVWLFGRYRVLIDHIAANPGTNVNPTLSAALGKTIPNDIWRIADQMVAAGLITAHKPAGQPSRHNPTKYFIANLAQQLLQEGKE